MQRRATDECCLEGMPTRALLVVRSGGDRDRWREHSPAGAPVPSASALLRATTALPAADAVAASTTLAKRCSGFCSEFSASEPPLASAQPRVRSAISARTKLEAPSLIPANKADEWKARLAENEEVRAQEKRLLVADEKDAGGRGARVRVLREAERTIAMRKAEASGDWKAIAAAINKMEEDKAREIQMAWRLYKKMNSAKARLERVADAHPGWPPRRPAARSRPRARHRGVDGAHVAQQNFAAIALFNRRAAPRPANWPTPSRLLAALALPCAWHRHAVKR